MIETTEAARISAKAQQFSTYVQMTEALTERQATVIRYYISLQSAVIGAGGAMFISVFAGSGARTPFYFYIFLLILCATGRYFCKLWREALQSLRRWESLKYSIIRDIEEKDEEFMELYAREWKEHGKETRAKSRVRVLALPDAFTRFYYAVALLVLIALSFKIDAQFFGGALSDALNSVFPGVGDLLSPPETSAA